MNYFKFHSVGQGLFYTGELANKTFNFVYDCGTKNKQIYLTNAIDSYVCDITTTKEKPEIEFVVISHLDGDHISGLYYLAQRAHIKKLFLPYIGRDSLFISIVLAKAVFDGTLDEEDFDKQKLFEFMCYLYRIGENYNFPQINVIFPENEEPYDDNYVCSYSEFEAEINENIYWKFILTNKFISQNCLFKLNSKLRKELDNAGIYNIVDFIAKGKNNISKVKRIYESVFKNLNITSTMLLHYPVYKDPIAFYVDEEYIGKCLNDSIHNRKHLYKFPSKLIYNNFGEFVNTKTLLTGDAEMDNFIEKNICKHLDSNFKCGVLQVPHHGAKDNWILLKNTAIRADVYVIPFGLGNIHKHPSIHTMNDITNLNYNVKFATQMNDFEYYID